MFTSVSRRDPYGPLSLDVSVRAVAGLGQWGAPLLTGSVDKLIDFISVSHTTPNPYWPDIHMFTVQRIMPLPSSVSLFFTFSFFLSHHISCVSHLSFFHCVLSTSLSLFISLSLSFPHSISLSPPLKGAF